MKRTLKKAMLVLLVVLMVCGTAASIGGFDFSNFGIEADAAEEFTSDYYTYTVDENGNATITDCDTSISGDITIPSTLDGYPVTSIGENAFCGCDLINITIPDSVTSIGNGAFSWCDLISVTIGNGVTSIGKDAFNQCNELTEITIPDSVTSIEEGAFSFCESLTNITIPDSVTSIGYQAFTFCTGLTDIIIPKNVTNIGTRAFAYCDNLAYIKVDPANMSYSNDEYGVLFNKNKINLIQYPIGNTRTNYKIPDSVTKIEEDAFRECRCLANVIIPDSVVSMGERVFRDCINLSSIVISKNLTRIESQTFSGCESLTNVTIPNNVSSLGSSSFSNCNSLESITIPNRVTSIEQMAFYECANLASVIISNSVTNIDNYAFYTFNLTDVYYTGTEEEWNNITIGKYNAFSIATIHYNYRITDDEPTTNPTEPTTTKPVVTEPSTTKPTEPSTTKPEETSKPVEESTTDITQESTTKPVEEPTTTKPVVTEPSTTKPTEPSTTKPSETAKEELIKKPSTTEVKYGETLILHADFSNIPADAKIEWSVVGKGVEIKPSPDGKTCAVTSTATGDATITAKYVDANGTEHVGSRKIESNASFWQKIVSFFKNLFRINRTIEQVVKFTF